MVKLEAPGSASTVCPLTGARFELVEIATVFERHRAGWAQIHAADPALNLNLGPEWVECAWRAVGAPSGDDGLAVLGWRGDELELVWPLAAGRRSLWSVLRPLASSSSEYAEVLVRPGLDAAAWVASALALLRAEDGFDLLELPNVRAGSALDAALAEGASEILNTGPSPFVPPGAAGWEGYEARLDAKMRSGLRRRRRQLEELGPVEFRVASDVAECERLIDWMLLRKAGWMEATGLTNDWLFTAAYRRFLSQSLHAFAPGERQHVMALSVGGRTVAAQFNSLTPTRLEGHISAFDPAFARWGPGQALTYEAVKWCLQRGLIVDFRPGDEGYKSDWATDSVQVRTHRLALSAWGRMYAAKEALKLTLGARGPSQQRAA